MLVSALSFSQYVEAFAGKFKLNLTHQLKPNDGTEPFKLPKGLKLNARSCNGATCTFRFRKDGKLFQVRLSQQNLSTVTTNSSASARKKSIPQQRVVYRTSSPPSELGGAQSSQTRSYATQASYGPDSDALSCLRRRGRHRYQGRRSRNLCYRGVKRILQDCRLTNGYMSTAKRHRGRLTDYAIWAHTDGGLRKQGFRLLNTKNPRNAPNGSVIVYSNHCSNTHPAGHIEIKLGDSEYVSDYISNQPRSEGTRCRRVAGIYIK